eukprot:2687883-Rhodomonas_salina.1
MKPRSWYNLSNAAGALATLSASSPPLRAHACEVGVVSPLLEVTSPLYHTLYHCTVLRSRPLFPTHLRARPPLDCTSFCVHVPAFAALAHALYYTLYHTPNALYHTFHRFSCASTATPHRFSAKPNAKKTEKKKREKRRIRDVRYLPTRHSYPRSYAMLLPAVGKPYAMLLQASLAARALFHLALDPQIRRQ